MPVLCRDCHSTIDETKDEGGVRQPCSACGSNKRRSEDDLESEMAAGAMMHTKGYAAGESRKKGLLFESKDGDSYSTSLGRFVHFHQLFDHVTKWVTKTVVDPVTGDVLREVNHPMEEHQDRGDAKERDP